MTTRDERLRGLGAAVAVVVARGGELPPGGAEAVTEAGGQVLVVGDGAAAAAASAACAGAAWWCETGAGLRPGELARRVAPAVAGAGLVVLPGSPDGRDLAPRLAAELGRPLLAGRAGPGGLRAGWRPSCAGWMTGW